MALVESYSSSIKQQQQTFPLTKKNLRSLQMQEPSMRNNEILERYCQEMIKHPPIREKSPAPQPRSDVVVASPRLLPFPYHNDSMFLPTAEHKQYHLSADSSLTSSGFTPDSTLLMSRPHSTTNLVHSSTSSVSQHLYHERRSLPARLDNLMTKRKYNGRLRPSSSSESSSVSSLSLALPDTAMPALHHTTVDAKKKPWVKRILKFFGNKKQAPTTCQDGNPVWYCQYSVNPAPRFHNQHRQQMVIVS